MSRDIYYLSYYDGDEIALQRQKAFCSAISKFIDSKCHFYLFVDSDASVVDRDNINVINIETEAINTFFTSIFEATIIFNNAFFKGYFDRYFADENIALIYHKLEIEFLILKEKGHSPENVDRHLKDEVYLMKNADWLYSSSSELIEYFRDTYGFTEHTHSIIPFAYSDIIPNTINDSFYDEGVHFLLLGDISVKQVKLVKTLMLSDSNNKFTVISENTHLIDRSSFLINSSQLTVLEYSSQVVDSYFPRMDYAIFLPKKDIASRISAESHIADVLTRGVKIICDKSWKSRLTLDLDIGFQELAKEFENQSVSDRIKLKEKALECFSLDRVENSIKFRNIYNLHFDLVNR